MKTGTLLSISLLSLKRPVLTENEIILEECKNKIRSLNKQCRSRYESVRILINSSKTGDALIILNQLMVELLNLVFLIYNQKKIISLEECEVRIKNIPNKKLKHLFTEVINPLKELPVDPNNHMKGKTGFVPEAVLDKLFWEVDKSYRFVKKTKMFTGLDQYKKRSRYQISMVFLLLIFSLVIGSAIWHFNKESAIEETTANMTYLAEMAYKAKKKTKKPLVQITGSGCSACVCRNGKNLKGIPDNDPCVRTWYAAVESIFMSIRGASNVPKKMLRDAWGSPYAIDENERENGKKDCRKDELRSAGRDGALLTNDDIVVLVENVFCGN